MIQSKYSIWRSLLAGLLTLVFLTSGAVLAVPDEPAAADGFALEIRTLYGNEVTVTGFSGPMPKTLEIPEGITHIGFNVFQGCCDFDTLILPTTLSYIGARAFEGCEALRSLVWEGDSLQIGYEGFAHCTGLEEVKLNTRNGNLNLISLTGGGNSISGHFAGCTSLKRLEISGGGDIKTYLGGGEFKDCTALETADLGHVAAVYEGAFENCPSLRIFRAPDLVWLDTGAVTGCKNLEKITLPCLVRDYHHEAGALNSREDLFRVFEGASESVALEVLDTPAANEDHPLTETESRALYARTVGAQGASATSPFILKNETDDQNLFSAKGREGLLAIMNFFRESSGLAPAVLNADANRYAQAGADYMTAVGDIGHGLAAGSGNEDANKGLANSNLARAWRRMASPMLMMLLQDDDNINKGNLLHRRWMMDSTMLETGMGYTASYFAPDDFSSLAVYVRGARDGNQKGMETFPGNGAFPVEAMSPVWSCSVPALSSLIGYTDPANLSVKITREDGRVTEIPHSATIPETGDWFRLASGGAGSGSCFIFSPESILDGESYSTRFQGLAGHRYTVEIRGITGVFGTDIPVCYEVNPYKLAQDDSAGADPTPTPRPENPDFRYSSDGTGITIDKYTGTDKDVVIPDTIAGLPVKTIGGASFYESDITSVVMPDSVTAIELAAFRGCRNLESVRFSANLRSIGDTAFSGCTSMTGLDLPGSLTSIGLGSFDGCTGLTGTIVLPASLESVDHLAFSGCTGADYAYAGTQAQWQALKVPNSAIPTGTTLTFAPDAQPSGAVSSRPSAGPQPTVSASAKPSVSTSPSASASPTSSATVAPRPSASVLPSSPPMPTAVTVPEIAGIEGYQGGRLNGKVYYMKTSGASMLLYQQRSSGSMGRVSVPYVTDADGTRYYPVNCGGTVLFPRLRNGSLEAYCRYEDGREIPVLAVQTIPGAAEDLQQFFLNGRQYYVRTSGASMLFYQKRSNGSMGRVSPPYVTDKNGTRFYPVNCGGTVLIPQLKNGTLDSYMAGTAAVLTLAA